MYYNRFSKIIPVVSQFISFSRVFYVSFLSNDIFSFFHNSLKIIKHVVFLLFLNCQNVFSQEFSQCIDDILLIKIFSSQFLFVLFSIFYLKKRFKRAIMKM